MLGQIFSFSGRTGRLGYLGVGALQLVCLIIGFSVLAAAGSVPGGAQAGGSVAGLAAVLLAAFALAWIGLAATVRRLRDMGWPILIGMLGVMFIPFVSLLLLFWPSDGNRDLDMAQVFSDPEDKPKRPSPFSWPAAKPKAEPSSDLAWMRTPAKPYVPAEPARQAYVPQQPPMPPNGARAQFGLRRQVF